MPPDKVDEECFTSEYNENVSPNSHTCGGEPYSDDFFTYSDSNNFFNKRHKVLFNLYAFDKLRSKQVNPPELEIVNCSFKYFVNHLDALINVETNNLGYLNSGDDDANADQNDD